MKRVELLFILFVTVFTRCSVDEDVTRMRPNQYETGNFFDYKGVDLGMQSLFVYLEEVDKVDPFISRFQKEYGIPMWNYSQCVSDGYSTGVYVPVFNKVEVDIHVIWYFCFTDGLIEYRPLEREEVKRVDTDSEWMFDFFSQKVLGEDLDDPITYKPHVTEPSLLRGWQEVITCVDAFVNDVFKGTHCWTSSVEWVAEDNPAPKENTIPGKNAGSYTGKIPANAKFTEYRYLSTIYGENSTLSHGEKLLLESAMSEFSDRSSSLRLISDWFKQENIKINFNIKANLVTLPNGVRDTVVAAFNKVDKTINFKNEEQITFRIVAEELIHAFQYYRFYHDNMDVNDKDYEFEAKVYMDLAAVCDEDSFSEPLAMPFQGYDNPSLLLMYWNWIELIEEQKGLFSSDLNQYYELGRQWKHPDYRGTFKSLEAKMLKQIFSVK